MEKIIISGFGGQGVLFVGKLLAYTGMVTGKHVSWIPSYGPEMRGGTANCSVIISEKEITSPIIDRCTTLLAFNEPSIDKFAEQVAEGGRILFDGSQIKKVKPAGLESDWTPIPTKEMIDKLGIPGSMNMIMLGAFIKENETITLEDIDKGLDEMLSSKRPELIENNKKAIRLGYDWKDLMIHHA